MGENHFRQVGARGYKAWLRARIRAGTSTTHRYKAHKPPLSSTNRSGAEGGTDPARKKCHRASSSGRDKTRVLQHAVLHSQKRSYQTETVHQPKTTKRLFSEKVIQNRALSKGNSPAQKRRLGHVNRLGRCVFPCENTGQPQEVPAFLCSRQMLSVSVPAVWSDSSTESLVQDIGGCSPISERAGGRNHNVFRRQFALLPVSETVTCQSTDLFEDAAESGVSDFLGQIRTRGDSGDRVYWRSVCSEDGRSGSPTSAFSENERSDQPITQADRDDCSSVLESFGQNGVNNSGSAQSKVENETSAAAPIVPLASQLTETISGSSSESDSQRSLTLVAEPRQHLSGHPPNTITTPGSTGNRLVRGAVGRGMPGDREICSGDLVSRGETVTYQCSRDESGVSSYRTLPLELEEHSYSRKIGQHERSFIHTETGRDKVSTAMFGNLEPVLDDRSDGSQNFLLSSEWGPKHPGRLPVSAQSSGKRMGPTRGSCISDLPDTGQTPYRPVCIRSDTPVTNVLFLEGEQQSNSDRCFYDELGGNIRLCVSPDISNPKNNSETGCGRSNVDPNSPLVAEKRMDQFDPEQADRLPSNFARQEGSAPSTNREIFPPRPRMVQISSVENLRAGNAQGQLSERANFLRENSIRSGSRKDYDAKYTKYSAWCNERNLNPSTCSVESILEFLASLELQQYAYSTICGYRSMISKYHDPIDGIRVGCHPKVTELLKGVFNINPPLKNLCPAWDVEIVLNYLRKEPFVPVETCSVKFLTLKTCMLLALTSARRADDIAKLSKRRNKCVLTSMRVVLTPDALIKQDRPGHVGKPITLNKYHHDVHLDIVSLLPIYLEKVKQLRGDESLLVTHVKPHKKPSAQTISRWLVEVIKLAYDDANLETRGKIKGHSTRAMGPSMAEFRGVAIDDILNVADWASAQTFYNCYWKSVDKYQDAILSVSGHKEQQ